MISLEETRHLLESTRWNSVIALTLLVPTLWIVGCATNNSTSQSTGVSSNAGSQGGGGAASSSSSSGAGGEGAAGGEGGAGGADLGLCGTDCSTITTPQCLVAVCNEGQYLGPTGVCVVVPAMLGTSCEDGLFCTVNDTCDNGVCKGGPQNDCALTPPACTVTTCDEQSKSCGTTQGDEGASCVATNLCEENGTCHDGECTGDPKNCSFAPEAECNVMACNPTTGGCEPAAPDAAKNGNKCLLTGDLCMVGRTCTDGQCLGGTPKDCSAMTVGCTAGTCNPLSGGCEPKPVPTGGECFDGITACHVGVCDASATCVSMALADGTACNDYSSCTSADTCSAGMCVGAATTGCLFYMEESFETCPAGWTFGGDWQCGVPKVVGPTTAHIGTSCIATQIHGKYSNDQSYDTAVADSPPISLVSATNPVLSFWTWILTEGSTFDGFNLKVSSDGGATFSQVMTVTPAYDLMIDSQSAWGGDHSEGWQKFTADLSAYAGQQIILRFAFHSDVFGVFPGVYIDDVTVAEAAVEPLSITTASPLPNIYTTQPYSQQIKKSGGSSGAAWSIVAGTNHGWLSIDPASGVLAGTATAADIGPVSVTVHVEEPLLPSNFAEKVFTFTVADIGNILFPADFEGACPNGWTLTGDWQCGTPTVVGPSSAYGGMQCIGTQLAGEYHNSQSWTGTTATSPDIALTTAVSPKLSFRMWVDTEGSTFDGANLKISTNAGATYTLVNNVVPAYSLTVNNEAAWGGHQGALGWQLVQVDLSAYIGQTIRLRFAFRSDGTATFPGVYIDDVLVVSN